MKSTPDEKVVCRCYRCGEVNSGIAIDVGMVCGGCGELNTTVTFEMACDTLNDLHLRGIKLYSSEDYEENIDQLVAIGLEDD